MKAKTIDHYFKVTKAQKVPMAFADAAALVKQKELLTLKAKGFTLKTHGL